MKKFCKCTLFIPFFLYMATMTGCSSTSNEKITHTDWCKNRYENAEELFKAKKYGRTVEKLEEILSTCAGSGYMEQAQFLIAESHFNLEQWIEARGEYGSFIVNFPGSPFAETAEFRKAVSSYNMEYKIDRDESNTMTAMKDFERYLANHPSTPLRDSVNYYYNNLVDRVAEKEFQTGRLYLRMEKPQAAVIYFKEFLETYPKAKRRSEVLFLISDAYTDLDQFESARQYLAIAQNESTDDAEMQKRVKKAEDKIAKAEETYEARLKKEAEKKRLQKEEKSMVN
ncbi:outer membrane protein assembly factor BamD [Fibrobacter sp.]|uniref:outer membrane protein assembly factor BamD n=1 Tax=Fibrobacter sp. TaxID=35828 RepID=UPI0025BA1BC4|nr:outer membrane protein assembly factor BamD [Fibrobacter sp.]